MKCKTCKYSEVSGLTTVECLGRTCLPTAGVASTSPRRKGRQNSRTAMTVSKYLPSCPCGMALVRAGQILCPECLEAERALAGRTEDEIVAHLRREWGTGWFTVRMAGLSRIAADALVRLGRLDKSKTPNTGTFNYRVRR